MPNDFDDEEPDDPQYDVKRPEAAPLPAWLDNKLDELVSGLRPQYDETLEGFRERVRDSLDNAFARAERVLEIARLRDALVACPGAVETDNRALAEQLHARGVRAPVPR